MYIWGIERTPLKQQCGIKQTIRTEIQSILYHFSLCRSCAWNFSFDRSVCIGSEKTGFHVSKYRHAIKLGTKIVYIVMFRKCAENKVFVARNAAAKSFCRLNFVSCCMSPSLCVRFSQRQLGRHQVLLLSPFCFQMWFWSFFMSSILSSFAILFKSRLRLAGIIATDRHSIIFTLIIKRSIKRETPPKIAFKNAVYRGGIKCNVKSLKVSAWFYEFCEQVWYGLLVRIWIINFSLQS